MIIAPEGRAETDMAKHKEPSVRQLRVGEELRHAMAEILGRGALRDPALSGRAFTVTEVRTSPDLKRATVFLTPLGGDADPALLVALDREHEDDNGSKAGLGRPTAGEEQARVDVEMGNEEQRSSTSRTG